MKKLKTLLLVASLAISSVLSASTTVEPNDVQPQTIREEIGKLLQNPSFLVKEEFTASVKITVNKNNEIVVLSVDSEDRNIDSYIKNRLNYQELPVALRTDEKTFIVPVRVTPNQ